MGPLPWSRGGMGRTCQEKQSGALAWLVSGQKTTKHTSLETAPSRNGVCCFSHTRSPGISTASMWLLPACGLSCAQILTEEKWALSHVPLAQRGILCKVGKQEASQSGHQVWLIPAETASRGLWTCVLEFSMSLRPQTDF